MRRREFLAAAGVAGGTAAAGGAGTASAQEGEDGGEDGGGGGGEEHIVEMNDQLQFAPSSLTVAPGDTVVWETVGSQPHNDEGVVAGGETYEHTFAVEGTYEYFCIPHEGAGMVGSIEVTQDTGGGGGGDQEPHEMGVPFQAHFVGISTILGIIISLVFTFYVLKYGESPHASDPNRK
ncbi:halocyanin [Halobacteriales archaeon QS_8_69_26]|nr:MAG: halocyanin [Halobacteriales archaeon QS_8_69_26]